MSNDQRGTPTRRAVIGLSGLLAGAGLLGCDRPVPDPSPFDDGDDTNANELPQRMPDEGEPHARTWMAFGPTAAIWSAELLPVVQANLAAVALAIAEFEPVSILVRSNEMTRARTLMGSAVDLIEGELDDLWIRDTGPTFVRAGSRLAGVDFNFNGWGNHQIHDADATVARQVTDAAGVERIATDLVLEGGALEVDGKGTAILTESCVLNPNRNPGWSKPQVEQELSRLLEIGKVIWLPGIAGMDITDGHTDFYARFAGPGLVVAAMDNDPESFDYDVTRNHLELLQEATDIEGNALEVVTIDAPEIVRPEWDSDDFAAGYINFYLANGAVIAPEFGDPHADGLAHETLAELFPDREVVQVGIDGIAAGGGGIHCATQQEPA